MARKERNPASPAPAAEGDAGFLSRWSRRKSDARQPAPQEPAAPQPEPPGEQVAHEEPEGILTDDDMPPLESLGPDSDYSPFWSPGVSDDLRRLALRRLFASPQFNIRDGLDDYDDDYTIFEPLRKGVAESLQAQAKESAQRVVQDPPEPPAEAGPGQEARGAADSEPGPRAAPDDSDVDDADPTDDDPARART